MTDVNNVINVIVRVCVRTEVVPLGADRCAVGIDRADGASNRAPTAMPSIALVWADGDYAGQLVAWVKQHCRIILEIVRKPEDQRIFEVPPRHWAAERALCWLYRWRLQRVKATADLSRVARRVRGGTCPPTTRVEIFDLSY